MNGDRARVGDLLDSQTNQGNWCYISAIQRLAQFCALATVTVTSIVQAQSVSDGGTPTVIHKLDVPPGVHGMAPVLNLAYAGSTVNGPLGVGWSLQAGSFITRCGATIATDGRKTGVSYGIDDKLCLNGQRLVRLNSSNAPVVGVGTNDAAGVAAGSYNEFRTESDSYVRIRSYGYANNDGTGASGPAYFKAWTKAGQVIEYGASPSADANTHALTFYNGSTIGVVWSTSRMSDVVGNHIDYKYEQRDFTWGSGGTATAPGLGHETNLLEIQYSGNKVIFSYSDRPTTSPRDSSEAYNRIGKNISVRRLDSVTTYVNSPNVGALGPAPAGSGVSAAVPVQTTKLGYVNAPVTGRSTLASIQTCAGAPGTTPAHCLPPTSFVYSQGGGDGYALSPGFNQRSLPMQSASGAYGVLVGDFDGDGKTDLIRWSAAAPSQNLFMKSVGDGSFTSTPLVVKDTNGNSTTPTLFTTDGCYATFVADVDGDGLPDLIRSSGATLSPTNNLCPAPTASLVLRNNGDGTFTQSTYTGPALLRDSGHNVYLMDYDGDGKVDIVAAVVGTGSTNQIGVYHLSCGDPSGVCTHVFHGNGDGSFTEVATNVGAIPVGYASTFGADPNLVSRVTDLDGDGLMDVGAVYYGDAATLLAYGLRSRGDGNFDTLSTNACAYPIDFNGDGTSDCLFPATKQLSASPGGAVPNFNLTGVGQELAGTGIGFVVADVNGDGRADVIRWEDNPANNALYISNGDGTFTASTTFNFSGVQLQKSDGSANFIVGDFTGQGNVEILRLQTVGGTPSNALYIKQNASPPDLLTNIRSSTGSLTSFYYAPLSNPFPIGSPSASLGPRYTSDHGTATAATFPTIDIAPPTYVVATMVTDSGVGSSTTTTEFSYAGLKADMRGRGALGFREVKRQSPGANGNPLTRDVQYMQRSPYIGMVAIESTFNSALNATSSANLLQKTVDIYCDQTAVSGADSTAISSGVACTTSALVQRPYLLYSTQTGQDLGGVALPTTTTRTAVNANADPTQVVVTTTGAVGGVNQTFTKTVTTQYQPDNTTCSGSDPTTCSWILSRATSTTVEKSAPNSLAALTTSAGTALGATATQGGGATQFASLSALSFGSVTVGAQPTATATLTNMGELPLTLTVPTSSSVTGAGFSFASTSCGATIAPLASCSITVKFTPTSTSAVSGTLTVATGAGSKTGALTGAGAAPSVSYVPVSTNWGTIGAASDSGDWPTIVNHSSVPVLITGHSVVSGPAGVESFQGDGTHCVPGTTVLQPGGSCQTFFGTGTVATVGSYTATDKVSYQAGGVTGVTFNVQQSYTFAVATVTATSASLSMGTVATGGSAASQTFTIANGAVNSPVNLGISMTGNQPASFPMRSTCGTSIGAGSSCTITVGFNPAAVGVYSAAVQVSVSYPRVQAGQATSYYPSTSSFSVPVTGAGAGAIATLTSATAVSLDWQGSSLVTYRNDGNATMTLSPPTLPAPLLADQSQHNCIGIAPGASCGIAVLDGPCCYTGSAAFVPTGTITPPAAVTFNYSVSGVVSRWSPASVNLGTVAVGSSASQTIQLYNDGSSSQDWTHHNTFVNLPAGFTIAATTSSTGAGNCIGIVNGQYCNMAVTFRPTASGTYVGSNVQPSTDRSENGLSLTGSGGSATVPFTVSPSSGVTATFTNPNAYAVTPTSSGVSTTDPNNYVQVTTNTCQGSIPAGGTCTITFTAAIPQCKGEAYTANAYVTDSAGTVNGGIVSRTSNNTNCE